MSAPRNIERPDEWPAPTDDTLERAVEATLAAFTAASEPHKNGTVLFFRHCPGEGKCAGIPSPPGTQHARRHHRRSPSSRAYMRGA